MMSVCNKLNDKGQMTIELAVALPCLLIIAAIAFNAVFFFAECARFDRLGRNAVRLAATSIPYQGTTSQAIASIESMLTTAMGNPNLTIGVSASQNADDYTTYAMKMQYRPTLFGLPLKGEIFGVALFQLEHETRLTVDTYKPGTGLF